MTNSAEKTDEEWRELLDEEAYEVLRRKGTERPFTGRYLNETAEGTYRCRGCGAPLFRSATKYDAGCGWPSFWEPVEPRAVRTRTDRSHLMVRREVLCSKCGGHLGHVFPDGPRPTGLRYCINSVSLDFERGPAGGGEDPT